MKWLDGMATQIRLRMKTDNKALAIVNELLDDESPKEFMARRLVSKALPVGRLTYAEWKSAYYPSQNKRWASSMFDGCFFKNSGFDRLAVFLFAQTYPNNVWTFHDKPGPRIVPGLHEEDTMGYFLTLKPWKTIDIEVRFNA